MDLQQGTCILLEPRVIADPGLQGMGASGASPACRGENGASSGSESGQLYQVIGVDPGGDRCWLRRWPLARRGSPVFEVSLRQLEAGRRHRPLPQGRSEG